MRNFLYKGVVATTQISQKININSMGVAWKEWTQKPNYNHNNFLKMSNGVFEHCACNEDEKSNLMLILVLKLSLKLSRKLLLIYFDVAPSSE